MDGGKKSDVLGSGFRMMNLDVALTFRWHDGKWVE